MFTKDFAISRIFNFLLAKALVIMQNYMCVPWWESKLLSKASCRAEVNLTSKLKFHYLRRSSYLSSRYVYPFVAIELKIVKGANSE